MWLFAATSFPCPHWPQPHPEIQLMAALKSAEKYQPDFACTTPEAGSMHSRNCGGPAGKTSAHSARSSGELLFAKLQMAREHVHLKMRDSSHTFPSRKVGQHHNMNPCWRTHLTEPNNFVQALQDKVFQCLAYSVILLGWHACSQHARVHTSICIHVQAEVPAKGFLQEFKQTTFTLEFGWPNAQMQILPYVSLLNTRDKTRCPATWCWREPCTPATILASAQGPWTVAAGSCGITNFGQLSARRPTHDCIQVPGCVPVRESERTRTGLFCPPCSVFLITLKCCILF